ncbi:MAG: hypothetical protein ACK5MU_04400, partial [Candidatus Saccharimonadales bacterium]
MQQSNRQETPFTTKKISAGEIQKNKVKGFSGGASGRVRPQAVGLTDASLRPNQKTSLYFLHSPAESFWDLEQSSLVRVAYY